MEPAYGRPHKNAYHNWVLFACPQHGGPKLKDVAHKCDTCYNEFTTCQPEAIEFGIDSDRSATGKDADKVVECSGWESDNNGDPDR